MVNVATYVVIIGAITFAYADPVPDPNWIIAGNPNLLANNPAIQMLKRMGGFVPVFDITKLPSPDSIATAGGDGFHGISTFISSSGHLDENGKWVKDVKGATIMNNEGDVKRYDLDGSKA